jgi:hypothetical protein
VPGGRCFDAQDLGCADLNGCALRFTYQPLLFLLKRDSGTRSFTEKVITFSDAYF